MPIPSAEGAAIVVRSTGNNWKRESLNRARDSLHFGLVWPAVYRTTLYFGYETIEKTVISGIIQMCLIMTML